MDFRLEQELGLLAEEARSVGAAAARRRESLEQSWVTGFDLAFSKELGERGWLGMIWPEELGGGGRPPIERLLVTEALISTGAPIAATWVGDRQIGPMIITYGSYEQKQRFLPSLIAGTVTWCIGMSEPDAGSDLASIRTRAAKVGRNYVIEGRKTWTSFAAEADFCYVIARTGSEGRGHAGLSEFIVDMSTSGIHVHPITDCTGETHFCEVEFDGVEVPAESLVGSLDGSWTQLMRQLEHERAGIDRLVSNRALFCEAQKLVDISDPLVRDQVARLEAEFRIGRLLVLQEVLGQSARSLSALVKVFCTEYEQRVAEFISTTGGPASMLVGRPSQAEVYATAYTIQGGTSEILRNVVAERLLGMPKGPSLEGRGPFRGG